MSEPRFRVVECHGAGDVVAAWAVLDSGVCFQRVAEFVPGEFGPDNRKLPMTRARAEAFARALAETLEVAALCSAGGPLPEPNP